MDGWMDKEYIYTHELSKAGAGGQGKEYIPMNQDKARVAY